MGGILSLCGPDHPCGGEIAEVTVKSKRNGLERQHLLKDDSDSSNCQYSPVSIESMSRSPTKSGQSITHHSPVPTKKITIAPILAEHIFTNDTFITIRKQKEANAMKLNDINEIVFQNGHWLIQGTDSIALEDHRHLFDIVLWRVPIIPAFAHFINETEFYNRLTDLDIDTEAIWSILSKAHFIKMFGGQLLDQIYIVSKDHEYLYSPTGNTLSKESDECKELIDKLSVIDVMKKANEIVIIGQKIAVLDLIRVIRKREVEHTSMAGMFKTRNTSLDWEIKLDDPEAPDPRFITSHSCVIHNVPLKCAETELQEFLSVYPRWTYASIMDSESKTEEKREVFVLENKSAKIEFDRRQALEFFVDDIERNGVYFKGNKLSVEKQEKELKKRKRRRLYAGHVIC